MRLLLLGKRGQVGWELQRALAPLGELIALDRHGEDGLCGDLARPDALAKTVRRLRPDVIVNAAAHTSVDKAEADSASAMRVNAEAPGLLAAEAAALGAWLVHYSSDYVLDGSGDRARDETAPTAPLNVYGRSKLVAEERIRSSGCRHLILRTSWIHAARGDNFVRTMLRLACERDRLTVVGDQVGAPTGAELIADVSAHAIRAAFARPALSGLYHLAASGEVSRYDYARFVIEWARAHAHPVRVSAQAVEPVPSSALAAPARRPANSRLATQKLQQAFGLVLPDWRSGVVRTLAELLAR